MRTSQFRQPSGSDEETGRDHAHPQPLGLWGPSRSDGQPPALRLRSAGPAPFLAEQSASYLASQEKQKLGIQGASHDLTSVSTNRMRLVSTPSMCAKKVNYHQWNMELDVCGVREFFRRRANQLVTAITETFHPQA